MANKLSTRQLPNRNIHDTNGDTRRDENKTTHTMHGDKMIKEKRNTEEDTKT